MTIVLALGRRRHKGQEFKDSLGYIMSSRLLETLSQQNKTKPNK